MNIRILAQRIRSFIRMKDEGQFCFEHRVHVAVKLHYFGIVTKFAYNFCSESKLRVFYIFREHAWVVFSLILHNLSREVKL